MKVVLERVIDVAALVYAGLYFPAPFFWLIIHPWIRFWRRFGGRAFWVALPLWTANAVGLILLAPRLLHPRLAHGWFAAAIGAALIAFGLGIGRRVHRDFGLRRLVGLPEVNPEKYAGGVVRSGIYSLLRHPRYLEYMLSFYGFALLTGARGIFLLAIVTTLMYLIVAPLEERQLREHYGAEYETYARAVPRFLPRLRRLTSESR
jgi:protein-S-isoprenylcysteine O-methyltransferase Ste14